LKRRSDASGFTLVEVIVAIAIIGISLVMIMQLFSGGLRASRTSCDYTRAVVHAKDKMEELAFYPVAASGEFDDGFNWETEVEPYAEPEESSFKLLKLKVTIQWGDVLKKPHSVQMVSLKAVSIDEG
jgi:general secretion pathway protein I